MKKNFILLSFILIASTATSFGQVYEKIYAESDETVQNKLNENKMNGIDILTGVVAKHTIGLTGLNISQRAAFENQLSGTSDILSYTISSDLSSVIIESKASYTREMIESVLQAFNISITGYSSNYSVL